VRARNKWGYGPFSDDDVIEASSKPDRQTSVPLTQNSGANVLITWAKPAEKGAEIDEYQVVILASDSVTFEEESVNCNGVDPAIISSRSCEIPINTLRVAPYNLVYPNIVTVKVRSHNINGWSDYSTINTDGAIILTEPATMAQPYRGNVLTD